MRKIFCIILLFSFSFSLLAQANTTPEANKEDSVKVFEKVEVEAEFPGGVQAWRGFLERNLNAQVPADKGAPAGSYTVVVRFIVD